MNAYITYLIEAYGFLLPLHQAVSGPQFADLIRDTYDLCDPRNALMAAVASHSNCDFTRNHFEIRATRNQSAPALAGK